MLTCLTQRLGDICQSVNALGINSYRLYTQTSGPVMSCFPSSTLPTDWVSYIMVYRSNHIEFKDAQPPGLIPSLYSVLV
jgi:hypothetical protein